MAVKPHRLIASIYISEGSTSLPSRAHVDDYGTALKKAIQYQDLGIDELIFMDVTPFNERRRNLPKLLKDASQSLSIPYVFGGGVHTVGDVEEMLKAGAPRIYVNSAAVRNPELINKISKKHGKDTLLVAIDTKKTFGKWKVYLNGGKSRTEIDLVNWVKMSEVRGAGELLISTVLRTSSTREEGYEILKEITRVTSLPILASIGFQDMEELNQTISIPGIMGIVSGHFFNHPNLSFKEIKDNIDLHFQSLNP